MKAFLAIQRMRLANALERLGAAGPLRRASAWARGRPLTATALALGIAIAAAIALRGPLRGSQAVAPESGRAGLRDAAALRDRGHELWNLGARHEAIVAYGRALGLDADVADRDLVARLLASFGTRDQREAEELIVKHRVLAAQQGLEALVDSDRYGVRWGAVHTLDMLELGTRANWERAFIADLEASDCRIRRTAVQKLGSVGTERAVEPLRAAKAREHARSRSTRCLGDRVDRAERRILARS